MYNTSPAYSIAGKCNFFIIQINQSINKSSQHHSRIIIKIGIRKKHLHGSNSTFHIGLAKIKNVNMIPIKIQVQDNMRQ